MIIMTVQLFWTAKVTAEKLAHGGQHDTGTFPKRSRNVNAYYAPVINNATAEVYPPQYSTKSSNPPGAVARIALAHTTQCPIFRQTDTGQSNPPIIG